MPVCCENNAARACAIEGFRLKAEDCTFRETSKNISHLECAAHRPSCEAITICLSRGRNLALDDWDCAFLVGYFDFSWGPNESGHHAPGCRQEDHDLRWWRCHADRIAGAVDQASSGIDHRPSARGAVCSDHDSGAKSNYDHSCAGNHDDNCAADDDSWADDDPRSHHHQGNHVTSRQTGFALQSRIQCDGAHSCGQQGYYTPEGTALA